MDKDSLIVYHHPREGPINVSAMIANAEANNISPIEIEIVDTDFLHSLSLCTDNFSYEVPTILIETDGATTIMSGASILNENYAKGIVSSGWFFAMDEVIPFTN